MKTMVMGLLAVTSALGAAACSHEEAANNTAEATTLNEGEFGNDALADNGLAAEDNAVLNDAGNVALPAEAGDNGVANEGAAGGNAN